MPRPRQQLNWEPTTSIFSPNITIRRYITGPPPSPSPSFTEPDSELSPDAETDPEAEPDHPYHLDPPTPLPRFTDNLFHHTIADSDLSVFTHQTPYINTRYLVILEALKPLCCTLRIVKFHPACRVLDFLAEPITISVQHLLATPVHLRPRKLYHHTDFNLATPDNIYQPFIPIDYYAIRRFMPTTQLDYTNNEYWEIICEHNRLFNPSPPASPPGTPDFT